MKNIFLFSVVFISLIFSQTSNLDISGSSAIVLLDGNIICADEITVQQNASFTAEYYGNVLEGNCTTIVTPIGGGTVTLPVEIYDSEALPTEFTIETAYPNPFNPVTNIKYSVPERSTIRILIYDVQGHTITELYNNTQEAGWYTISWNGLLTDGNIAPAGIYLMKIINSSNSKSEFKSIKISLIK